MPFAEALERAGSFEALLPHLREGSILARCQGIYSWPSGRAESGPRDIPPEWWAKARIDPATGRVILTAPGARVISPGGPRPPPKTREVFAIGIELEAAAVETLFPVSTVSVSPVEAESSVATVSASPVATEPPVETVSVTTPLARKKSKGKKGTSAAGTKELPLWKANIVPHLKTLFPGKPYPSKNESFHAAKDWLLDNNKSLSDSAIREGIKRHFPKWFPDDD